MSTSINITSKEDIRATIKIAGYKNALKIADTLQGLSKSDFSCMSQVDTKMHTK